jgi:hypothetical protein
MGQLVTASRAVLMTAVAATIASLPLVAQSPAPPSRPSAATARQAYKVPRTADGQPDLTGNWSNATFTPLERPAAFADKEFFTAEEAEAFAKSRDENFNAQAADDIHYDNAIWQSENYKKGVSTLRTSLIIDPPDGKLPPLTDEARRRPLPPQAGSLDRIADSYETRTLGERCITWGNDGPPMTPPGYNANLDIVQGSGYVVVRNEMVHSARVIPIDSSRPHVGEKIRMWGGDSRGHWEGNTLVVETTNFNDKVKFRNSTRALHVVERFTRVDADTIDYRFTVDDPNTWTRPWTASIPLWKVPGPIYEYACHEGNYGLPNILRAQRVEDQKNGRPATSD